MHQPHQLANNDADRINLTNTLSGRNADNVSNQDQKAIQALLQLLTSHAGGRCGVSSALTGDNTGCSHLPAKINSPTQKT
jgi:hypothetical protein